MVFGPQKGATPDQVAMLDAGLARLATLLGDAAAVPRRRCRRRARAPRLPGWAPRPRHGADLVMEETRFADVLATRRAAA